MAQSNAYIDAARGQIIDIGLDADIKALADATFGTMSESELIDAVNKNHLHIYRLGESDVAWTFNGKDIWIVSLTGNLSEIRQLADYFTEYLAIKLNAESIKAIGRNGWAFIFEHLNVKKIATIYEWSRT